MSSSSLLRKRGLEALCGQWQTALLITFAAYIFSMALSVLRPNINTIPGALGSLPGIFSYCSET